jgi:Glycosyltransferase family 87
VRSKGGNNADGPHGRRRSVEDPRLRLSAAAGGLGEAASRRNLGAAGLAWFLVLVAAVTGWWVFQPALRDAANSDLTLVYIGARIGLEHGWSHIYSLDLQTRLFAELRPGVPFGDGERFLSPPPLAWLILPLTLIGLPGAFYAWSAISLAALAAAFWLAAPGAGLGRWLWLLGALAWYPMLYSLSLGQPAMIVLLAIAASWRLAKAEHEYLAGAVLGLSVVKPQLALAVPAVLLVAGRWRIAAAWVLTAGILAAGSVIVIGAQGLADYRHLVVEAQMVPNNRYFTLAYLLGPGVASYAAAAAVAGIGLVGAYLNRGAGLPRLFALGLVTSTLSATYWHLQDFTILVMAAWLFWRDDPPPWQRAWLLVVVFAGELAWPLSPLPMLVALAGWFAFLVVPAHAQRTRATAATAAA